MRWLSDRCYLQLLYVGLLIFSKFLQMASEQLGGITDRRKERCLLLQVAPEALVGSDIFNKFKSRGSPRGWVILRGNVLTY